MQPDPIVSEVRGPHNKEPALAPPSDNTTLPPGTRSSLPVYDDVYNTVDKLEVLERAQNLGLLLISLDGSNASWRSMFADILIVKG